MLEMIKTDKLFAHKNNPRKDLGALDELVASIREKGVLQNLTVVKQIGNITKEWIEGTYTIVIGHRRHAAAKLAGLEELPCVVVDMSEREQLATMLLENMQRCDLSIIEQAQGVQMMMDLGDSVAQIAQATGLSETTVRRRADLAKYDAKQIEQAVGRGATIMQLAELEKIEDAVEREQVLKTAGTNNFEWNLKSAILTQEWKQTRKRIIEELNALGVVECSEVDHAAYVIEQCFDSFGFNELDMTGLDVQECRYRCEQYGGDTETGTIYLYKKREQPTVSEPAASREKTEAELRVERLNEMQRKMDESIAQWMNMSPSRKNGHEKALKNERILPITKDFKIRQ